MRPWLSVVGIGEDGLPGLGDAARMAVREARVLVGGSRHLDLVPEGMQERVAWPSPFAKAYDMLLARRGTPVCVLASGDPMWFGIAATLTRMIPAEEMRIFPAVSSFQLAAARMGWPLQDVATLTVHGRPLEGLHPHIHPGVRLLVLSENGRTPAAIAALLTERGFGPSLMSVLAHLGGPEERRLDANAASWPHMDVPDLNLVAVDCIAGAEAQRLPIFPGLPDSAFENDGQLTKRDVRAATLARLAPLPGELLWDVGAGCGSIGIEWMRAHTTCRAIAIEADAGRSAMIERNAKRLGVPSLRIVLGRAPSALDGLDTPDAVFIGGGVTEEGLLARCWDALRPGGRLVANAVTLQSEALLADWRQRTEGELVRIAVAHAGAIGRFDTLRPALPVTILSAVKPF